ncbi:MAG: DMT family transporter [Actinobacteria bacterium]|nr:DMT family transporter [Actinomycetota bacterium]
MALVLGCLAALCWGAGDFAGGLASRRTAALTVVLATESIGLVLLLAVALLVSGAPTASDLGYGAGAGILGVAGLALLFRGLATGRASVVAPLSAVGAAVIQVGWGLLRGEEPGPTALVGIVLALVAIGIVAGAAEEGEAMHRGRRAQELGYGLGAALGFGVYLVLISETGEGAGLWPLVSARVAPILLLLAVLPLLRQRLLTPRSVLPLAAGSGLADAGANILLLIALREGLLSLVSPVANLYPAVTVLLARGVQHERLGRPRAIGLGIALASLVLIAL